MTDNQSTAAKQEH